MLDERDKRESGYGGQDKVVADPGIAGRDNAGVGRGIGEGRGVNGRRENAKKNREAGMRARQVRKRSPEIGEDDGARIQYK